MSHGCCPAGIPATHARRVADFLQRWDSLPCAIHNSLSMPHINAAGVKLEVSSHTPWTGAYRRAGKLAYNLSSIIRTWKDVKLMNS